MAVTITSTFLLLYIYIYIDIDIYFLAALGLHCGMQAFIAVACGLSCPTAGMEAISSAVEGGFLTPGPPVSPLLQYILEQNIN